MTSIRVFDKSLLPSMDEQLYATDEWELGLFVGRDSTDRENSIRADGNARPGGFAAHRVDNWNHKAGVEFAVRFDITKDWFVFLCGAFHVCFRDSTPRMSAVVRSKIFASETKRSKDHRARGGMDCFASLAMTAP